MELENRHFSYFLFSEEIISSIFRKVNRKINYSILLSYYGSTLIYRPIFSSEQKKN